MFDNLAYCTRIEHGVLNILYCEKSIAKGSKIFRLYILKRYNVIVHLSSYSEHFHDKNKLFDLR